MDTYTQSTLAMLAVINPFVCGTIMLQLQQDQDTKSNFITALKTMAVVLIILLVSALVGKYILHAFGISMDAFKVVGGIILAFIGFQMLGGSKSGNNVEPKSGLTTLILFAASPGTIAMVISLAAVHNGDGLPVAALVGTTIAVAITVIVIVLMQLLVTNKKVGGQGIMSQFMGLIIVAMGLQFLLDGIKHFFGV
jgi:multiple antibiotic resistance protein